MLEMFKAACPRWAPKVQSQTIFHTPLCGPHSRETCVRSQLRLGLFSRQQVWILPAVRMLSTVRAIILERTMVCHRTWATASIQNGLLLH